MKKKFFFTPGFLLVIIYSYSQEKENYFKVSAGPSFPFGNYSSKNLKNSKSGFAKTGQQVNISYTYKLTKKVGLTASLYAQRNPVDGKALARQFSEQDFAVPISFGNSTNTGAPQPFTSVYYSNWRFDKHAWLAASFLAGAAVELPFNKNENLSFIANAMIGIIGVKSPELQGTSTTDTTNASVHQNSASAFGVTWLVRRGVKYTITKKISLVVAADYNATNNMVFKNIKSVVTTYQYNNGLPSSSRLTTTGYARQILQSINLNAGIAFRL